MFIIPKGSRGTCYFASDFHVLGVDGTWYLVHSPFIEIEIKSSLETYLTSTYTNIMYRFSYILLEISYSVAKWLGLKLSK